MEKVHNLSRRIAVQNTYGQSNLENIGYGFLKTNLSRYGRMENSRKIRDKNPERPSLIILDNFRSHHPKLVAETAGLLNIMLIFLPTYYPDLNPTEFIQKKMRRVLSIAPKNWEEYVEGNRECPD